MLARTVSKVTGYTVMLIDSSNVNNGKTVNGRKAIGSINSTKGEIVLDIGEGNVATTSLHESVHYIRINAPEEFNAMAKYVVEWLTHNGVLEEYLDRYASSYKLDNIYDLTEEITADVAEALLKNADFVEDLFTDEAFAKEICGENRTFAEKFVDALKSIIEAIKNYLKSGDVNHLIAGKLSEDAKALEEIKNLWEDGLKAAVDNHSKISNAKENTDTQSSGGMKYSKAEKNALTKEEYKRATAAFMNGDTSAIIEDCAIRVTNKNDVYKIKIVCYNLSDDGFDFQITEVYQIENYDYNIHSENEDPAVIIAKGVRDGYTQREIEALLQNNKFDDGQIFKRFSPQSGRYYRLKKSTGRGERVSGGKSSGSGLSEETEQSETESKLKFSLSEPVEEKDNLIAVQNIYTDKLAKSLKLGGFPMPSIVISKPDMSKVSDISIKAYKNFSIKEAKKPIKRIAEMLGIYNVNYKNSNIKFDFAFSKISLDTSLNHQREYGGSYTDYAEMLTCLDKLVENAELIEVHENYKDDEQLKRTFVLISAINNDGNIAPVQLEVKEYDKGQSNSLYLNVVLSKIKESAVVKGEHNGNADISNPLVADSAISLSQLFANVNPTDKRFLKYVPDNFLSTEQIEAKREAQKSDYKNYDRYVEVFENDKDGSDNKFSLSEPVEEKDNLIAVHNIYTDKLAKSLKLGGFPMPSIAVTKADMGHENYGECSFVFDKSTIDPKVDKRNKAYGGDAWTPTYPAIEYKASEDVIQRVKDTREHNLFGKDGKFMHCSGGAFLLPETLNVKLRSRWQRLRSADFLCGIHEFDQLSVSVLACVSGFLDGIGEIIASSAPASSKPLSAFSRAVLLEFSSRSMPFKAACALFSCICQL